MADILNSAQAQIDDAAQQIGSPAAGPPPTDPNPPQPQEETLLSSATPIVSSKTDEDQTTSGLDLPFSSRGHDLPQDPEPIPIVPPPVAKKHGNKSLILAVILFLVATLPLAVYFTSQQRQLADLRGKAQEGAYACTDTCVPARVECSDGGGVIVAGTCSSGRFCCNFGSNTPTITRGTTPTITVTVTPDSCGNAGQACCDPFSQNGTICNGSLYCNTATGTCQSTAPPNLCQGSQGSGGGVGTECEVFRCGSQCNAGNQCTISAGRFPCDQATLNDQCGQIDWKDTSGNYCGVKSQNCGGSCAGGTTAPPGGNPPPGGTQPPGPTATHTPPPGSTPTPTPIPGGTCELIKIYDAAGTEITQAVRDGTKKLALDEQVTIATTKGNATKARFRIQGIADWTENDPSKTTTTEYRLSITIPSTMTQAQGTFEVEVYVNGVWK